MESTRRISEPAETVLLVSQDHPSDYNSINKEGNTSVSSEVHRADDEANLSLVPHSISRKHFIRRLHEPYDELKNLGKVSEDPLRDYYLKQIALLHDYRAALEQHSSPSASQREFLETIALSDVTPDVEAGKSTGHASSRIRRAIIASNCCNFLLLFVQIFVVFSTGSLSFLAVLIDASLDMISGLVILYTWSMKKIRNKYDYPVGRTRLGPLGVIGMACIMTAATLGAIQEALRTLVGGKSAVHFSGLTGPALVGILFALGTKLCLYLYCVRSDDVSVKALATDHINDVMANSTSLATAVAAQRFFWWLDPIGGLLISLLIIRNWLSLTFEQCNNLLGKCADHHLLSVITFMACNHHPELVAVDTVTAYHVGEGVFVEVDIVLNKNMVLQQAHDIGESLQRRIEQLHEVERAFVHLDTEFDHKPEEEHMEIG